MNWDKGWNTVKILGIFLLSILTICFCNARQVSAHSPHDVVIDVELSPDFEGDRTAYALLDGYLPIWGNLFKSQDGGATWTRIERGLDNQHELSAVAVSPQDKKTLYLSTLGDGVYRSRNGGASWNKASRGLENLNIDLLAIAPNKDLVLAAGTEGGLYLTENGGNWSSVQPGKQKITAIAFTPTNNRIIVGDEKGNLYSSRDRGKNWQQLATVGRTAVRTIAVSPDYKSDRSFWTGTERGIWHTVDGGISFQPTVRGMGKRSVMSLAISPNYKIDRTLWASTWHEGVFRSTNGGASWNKQSRGLKQHSQADTKLYKSPHFSDLKISPTFSQDGTLLLAGFDGVFKSTDSGSSWRDVNLGKGAMSIRNITVSPNYQRDRTVAISTIYQGVYLSRDGGDNWTPINHGLATDPLLKQNLIAETGDLIFSPNYERDRTILASSWGGIAKTNNAGRLWHKLWVPKSLRRDNYMAVSPNYERDRTVYLVTLPGKILQSTNGGKHFALVGDINAQAVFIPSLVISPNYERDRTLYLGNFTGGVYKSVDAGNTWQLLEGLVVEDNYAKLAISPDYQNDRTVFAATAQGLWLTEDGGTGWRRLPGTAYGTASYIENIALSPNFVRDRTFLVSVRGKGLFKTQDNGQTFMRIGEYLTGPIQFSPTYERDRTIFASSGAELIKSTDSGSSWQAVAIPQPDYNWLTILYHLITNSPARRYLTAALVAIACYLLLGSLRWGKNRPLSKWQLKTSGAFTAFVGALSLLSV